MGGEERRVGRVMVWRGEGGWGGTGGCWEGEKGWG